jgi:hypothetical protein
LAHIEAKCAPHSSQYFAPVRFSCPQFEHVMRSPRGSRK